MAQKKTITRKQTTETATEETKVVTAEETAVESDAEVVKTQKAKVAKTANLSNKTVPQKGYKMDDLIPCRSVTAGELLMGGAKSKLLYSWSGYGDVVEVEYQDLLSLVSRKSGYLTKPRFIIEDLDLLENHRFKSLKPVYEKFFGLDDMDTLFSNNADSLKNILRNMPKGLQDAVKVIATTMIEDGRLDSLSQIKAIDEALGTELKLYIEH